MYSYGWCFTVWEEKKCTNESCTTKYDIMYTHCVADRLYIYKCCDGEGY
jgi:hypothetical protein